MEAYLTLNKNVLAETGLQARQESLEVDSEDKDTLTYPNLKFVINELYFDAAEERLVMNGSMYTSDKNQELGYFSSFDIPIDFDLVIDMIQAYMKKLGKLKTVLEATK
ncbi:hypothetical protein M0R04_14615 [Candidatus Dojkabacteria bacterium]|jgi:hypothetical protein|nr:hypothetical protein [Candidatus Dojkabacteria bacterium]